jgi:hypothetical protein
VGFIVDKMTLEQVSSEYYDPACQFSFHQLLHIHLIILSLTLCSLDAESLVKQQKKNERMFMPVCPETLIFLYNEDSI